jgi:hypothetical protein
MKYLRLFENFENLEFVRIHGLPGSGKTYLSNKIKKENPEKDFIILDDIGDFEKIEQGVKDRRNIIMSSPFFENFNNFYPNFSDKLKDFLGSNRYILKEYWFENNPEACIKNVKMRTEHKIDSRSVITEIPYYSLRYKIPPGVETLPVYNNFN